MRKRKASLGPILQGLLAFGLCTPGPVGWLQQRAAAQQSAPADASTKTVAPAPETRSGATASQQENETGVSNPDPVVPEAAMPESATPETATPATATPATAQAEPSAANGPAPAANAESSASPTSGPAPDLQSQPTLAAPAHDSAQATTPAQATPPAATPAEAPAAAAPQQAPATSQPDTQPAAPDSNSGTQAPDASTVNSSLPARQVNAPEPPPASRIDIFAGYAYLRPSGSIGIYKFPDNNTRGYIASGTYYFGTHLGVQAEFSHSEYPLGTTGTSPAPPFVQLGGVTDNFYTAQAGPVYRFFLGQHVSPFVHATGGGARVAGPKFQPPTWGYGFTGGGGVDLILPHTHSHVAFRAVQADYEYMHANQGTLQPFDLAGGTDSVTALRLSAGLVFRFGEQNPVPSRSLACDATPSEVYSGERVTLAANLRNYRTQRVFAYRWELGAGKQVGFGPVIFVDTTGLASGSYRATAHISLKEKGKQFAQCSTNFVVKDSPPPSLKCSPNPSTVVPGEISTITSYAGSIAQRKLTYSYSTTEGQIGGTDSTTQLHTDGLPPGTATVTCRVQDDLGRTAVATTEVTISSPALPPAPKAQPLCTVYFNRDQRRPARVDNEGRACLDDVALTMEHQPDARLVLVGEHSDVEVDGQITAAERAINTRAYLANEKGIDPSRVDVRSSTTPGRQVQTFLLAPGAVFDQPTEGRIDESKVKIHGQQYVNQRRKAPQGPAGEGVSHPPKQ